MDKLCKTAKGLDVFFKIMFWICVIMLAGMLIGIVTIQFSADAFQNLNAEKLMFSYNGIQMPLDPEIGTQIVSTLNLRAVVTVALSVVSVGILFVLIGIKLIRDILEPMKNGLPFKAVVSKKLRTLGIFAILYGIMSNAADIIAQKITLSALSSSGYEPISVDYTFSATPLLIAALLFLCSYIVQYGETLQNQADETL